MEVKVKVMGDLLEGFYAFIFFYFFFLVCFDGGFFLNG